MKQQTASPSMACLSLSIVYCSHGAPDSCENLSSCADRFLSSCHLLFVLSTSFSFTQIFSQLLLLFTGHQMGFSAQIPYHNSCPVVWSLHGCCPPLSPSEPTRGEEHLDLLFTRKKEIIRDVIMQSSFLGMWGAVSSCWGAALLERPWRPWWTVS